MPPDGDQLYVYGPVPPEGLTVAEPFVPPLQLTFVLVVVALTTVGCVIVTLPVVVHPFASVIVHV